MKVELFTDGMAIIPETMQDQAYLRDTIRINPDAGSVIFGKRVNYAPDNPFVARLVFVPSEEFDAIPEYATSPESEPSEKPPESKPKRQRKTKS